MSKQALAVKYRPKRFNDVVEQDVTKAILSEQLMNKTFKNCLLFCGGAGTGKTTSARIFANEINDFKGKPIEIDAASNNSVEDVRKLIEQAKTQSLDSEYKVFILDECVTGDTEILTDKGYKAFQDLDGTELIGQFADNNTIEFVKPDEYINKEYEGIMYNLHSDDFDIMMSPHHVQIVYNTDTTVTEEVYIKDFIPTDNYKLVSYTAENNSFAFYDSTKITITEVPYKGNIYCVKVPTHRIAIRTNSGFEFMTGNCHMLSNAAWNALLKLIEEPPAKTVLMLCTTDPQKIPDTILSRVQRFNFQKISMSGIIGRLKYITKQENDEYCESHDNEISKDEADANLIEYEESAIEYIAKTAEGGMRNAITLLDKAIGFSNKLTLNNVLEALGSVNYDTMFDLTDALNIMDKKKVISIIESIHNSGLDLKQFIKQYNYFVLDLCKYDLFRHFEYLQLPEIYSDKLSKYDDDAFAFFNQLLSEISSLNNNLKWETMPKPLVEATLLQLCMEA